MGKLMHSTQLQHSSHPHLLQLSSSNLHLQNHPSITCAGCSLPISATTDHHTYTCPPCNFFLHPSCSKFPDLITHPSHPQHTLSLLPTCIYPGGFFRCDACAQQGNRFSYHCQVCDFDLHVLCAAKPLSVPHPSHPHHLHLTFVSPYGEKVGFSCDLCRNVGSGDQWLYRCVSCEFDAHLHCATAKPTPALQHHHSLPNQSVASGPVAGPGPGRPLAHSVSAGRAQGYWQPSQNNPASGGGYQQPQPPQVAGFVGGQGYQQQPQPQLQPGVQNYRMQPQPQIQVQAQVQPGVQNYQMQPQPQVQAQVQPGVQNYQMQQQPLGAQNNGIANGLGNAMVTGFVEGMMQQLGQDLVQGLTDGGGGGGYGDGGDTNVNIEINTTNEDYDSSYS